MAAKKEEESNVAAKQMQSESSRDTSSSCTYTDSYCCEEEFAVYVPCIDNEEVPFREPLPEEHLSLKLYNSPTSPKSLSSLTSPISYESNDSLSSSKDKELYGEEFLRLGSDRCLSEYEACFEGETPSIESCTAEEETKKQSVFVHSSPTQFPDIARARKSVFGSVFVRAVVPKQAASTFYRKTGDDSQFSMIPGFLSRPSKGSDSPQSEKRSTLKGSVFRVFEKRGITKELSGTSSSQWDVFPITKSALFSFQVNDRIHQTRYLSRIEDRIANAQIQILKFCFNWPSGSSWTGHWDSLGMAGLGTYMMPHEVCYIGKMQDGMCHDDDATLIYPNGFRAIHCNYVNGELTDYQFQFPDSLEHEKENWGYCQYPDRRFWSEVQNGLKPAKTAQKTQEDPPRKIPPSCYDTNDGFYNPKTKMLLSPDGELLRVPTCEEEHWIRSKCRKGFQEHTRFRPNLYENWYNNDKELINSILNMQRRHLTGEITFQQLNQFYAENDLLPSCSPYRKTKTLSEMAMEKMPGNVVSSKKCMYRLQKRYRDCGIRAQAVSPGAGKKKKSGKHSPSTWERKSAKKVSHDKLSMRIKFSEGNKTGMASMASASLNEKGSSSIPKKAQRPLTTEMTTWNVRRRSSDSSSGPSAVGESGSVRYEHMMKRLVMEIVDDILLAEREKHRDRFVRTQSVSNLPFGARDDKERCIQVLQELHASIPEEDEFCDSSPAFECDLKKLAEDRFQMVKYWGKRIFTLHFDDEELC